MISDRDIWAAALLMVKRYRDDAGSRCLICVMVPPIIANSRDFVNDW
jgi:hypothetical protein